MPRAIIRALESTKSLIKFNRIDKSLGPPKERAFFWAHVCFWADLCFWAHAWPWQLPDGARNGGVKGPSAKSKVAPGTGLPESREPGTTVWP